MIKKILAVYVLAVVISVSACGCGSIDEETASASEQSADEAETESSEESDQESDSDTDTAEETNSDSDSLPDDDKHIKNERMIPEEVFDVLYGEWESDGNSEKLIFSAGAGDLSYKAELKSPESYGFSLMVSYFDAARVENGTKIRFVTGNGGIGSCKELILSDDEKTVSYKTGRHANEDGEFFDTYITFHRISHTVSLETDSKWKGKTGAFLGDSITQGINTTEGKVYWNYLADMLELGDAEAYGLAGSCISSHSDMGTGIIPFVTRYKDIRKDADFIVVFGGTNDYGFNTPLGTEDDTTDVSFYGALYEMLSGLKKEHPNASIVYMTPLHRFGFGGLNYDRQKNDAGFTLYNYIDAIKLQCQRFDIPVIDANKVYGMDPSDKSIKVKYLTDGLHPNEEGHRILAERIASCFEDI